MIENQAENENNAHSGEASHQPGARLPSLAWAALLGGALLICAALSLLLSQNEGSIARIYLEGELVEIVDLQATRERRAIPITMQAGGGNLNVVEVEQGRIRVAEADCSGGDCIRQGWSSGAAPIICLPHRLVIVIETAHNLDAIVG